jgi:PKD repeat protein/photosystem II stability/assembly factor-like uncharacterized protein
MLSGSALKAFFSVCYLYYIKKKLKMKHKFYLFAVVLLMHCILPGSAQNYTSLTDEDFASYPYWIEMMDDQSVNFFDVQHAFEIYWKDREIIKGCGWKPFKRWEYMMSSRIYADGTRLPVDLNWNAYQQTIEQNDKSVHFGGDWSNLGPFFVPGSKGYNGLGRIISIAFHPTDENTIFIGAPAGGLWVTHDKGQSWHTETDVLPTLGVSSIVIDHVNPDVMYIGSGDRDSGDSPGMGVLKSYDSGMTWELHNNGMGLRTVGRMIMHPEDNMMLLAATNAGIYKTTDGGANWQIITGGNFKEIVFKTDDPSEVYASANGSFYRSENTGESFEMITSGLPAGYRGVIGLSAANPEVVYFLITTSSEFIGLYRSLDAGLTFIERSTTPNIMSWGCKGGSGGQAWFDLDIADDPENPLIIFAGGVNCFKSTDGGVTWNISSHWWGDCGVPAVHADLHVLEYSPLDGRLYAGNDGGIYWTGDGGTSWYEISDGLAVSQTYKIGQSATMRDKVINGYQDNGSATYTGSPSWIPVIGGDGMECEVDHENPVYSYGTLYYGDIFRITNNVNPHKVAGNDTYGINESGGWVTPFLLHKGDANRMFVGYKNIWRGNNLRSGTPQWQKISDNLGNSNSSNMRVLEQSPVSFEILYAARDDKKLFRCDNVNKQNPLWSDISGFLPDNSSINDLEAHPFDEQIVYMAQGTKIYKSADKGQSWEDISGSLPGVTMNSIAYYENSHEGLYVATDIGIYYKDAFLAGWIRYSDGFPASGRVTEAEIYHDPQNPENDVIRACTYGRGLWESEMYYDTPVADFEADQTLIPPYCEISFFDLSAGVPTSWQWEFEGADPAYSNEKNPGGIVYEQPGSYKVTLTVSNKAGTDQLVLENYVTVSADLLPVPDFSVSSRYFCSDEIVSFSNHSLYCPHSYAWSFTPDNVVFVNGTTAESQNPEVMFTETGPYSVTLIVENENGSATLIEENLLYSGGHAVPVYENFEEGFDAMAWTIENPDHRKTWELVTPEFVPGGEKAVMMNFFDYYHLFERDRLITPPMNLEGVTEAQFSFRHAYAQRYSQVDSLIIKISVDCGNNWQRVYANGPDGNGIFETAMPVNTYFSPASPEDWCGEGYGAGCITIDLSPFAGQPDVIIMFEAMNRIGNNLYIDEVEVSVLTGVEEFSNQKNAFRLYPNPSFGEVNLVFLQENMAVQISVFSLNGKLLHSVQAENVTGIREIPLSLGHLTKGAYIVKIIGSSYTLSKLLILN